jgi:HPt (histidine-containing phosphotransfer) domain-containing protein
MTQTHGPNPGGKIIVHVDTDIKDLVPGFLQNRQKDVKSLLAAVERSDYGTIEALGHTMKGDGGGYGFHAITDIGGSLEKAAAKKNLQEIRKWVKQLTVYLECVEIVYK